MSGTSHWTTQHHIPEYLKPQQQQQCLILKSHRYYFVLCCNDNIKTVRIIM
jgi:hypothetical protein